MPLILTHACGALFGCQCVGPGRNGASICMLRRGVLAARCCLEDQQLASCLVGRSLVEQLLRSLLSSIWPVEVLPAGSLCPAWAATIEPAGFSHNEDKQDKLDAAGYCDVIDEVRSTRVPGLGCPSSHYALSNMYVRKAPVRHAVSTFTRARRACTVPWDRGARRYPAGNWEDFPT